jgi:hypothetical protein
MAYAIDSWDAEKFVVHANGRRVVYTTFHHYTNKNTCGNGGWKDRNK